MTAGIDFGLRIAAILASDAVAKAIQLGLEYDPEPPFRSGHPDVAEPAVLAAVRARFDPLRSARVEEIRAAKRREST